MESEPWTIKVSMLHCPFILRSFGENHCTYNELQPCTRENCKIKDASHAKDPQYAIFDTDDRSA